MLVSLGFGVWAVFNQHAMLGVLSLAASAGLVVYANYFVGKARKLGV
jgi:hypothetical protein